MTFDHLIGLLTNLFSRVKNLLAAGITKRIVVKNAKGNTFADLPVTVAAIVTILLPVVTGLAAIAALILGFSVSVEPTSGDSQTLGIRNRPTSQD